MKFFGTAFIWFLLLSPLYANSTFFVEQSFAWQQQSISEGIHMVTFDGAVHSDEAPLTPFFLIQRPVDGPGTISVTVESVQYETFTWTGGPRNSNVISEDLQFTTTIESHRGQYFAKITLAPIIKAGSQYRRVTQMRIRVDHRTTSRPAGLRSDPFVNQSVLSSGTIYKFAVSERGMYRLTYDFLQDELGIANLNSLNPDNFQLFGNGGGYLPENIRADRPDDLTENHIQIVGGDDGQFNSGDYILFYAEGPDKWLYHAEDRSFDYQKNIYDTKSYYYLKVDGSNGQRTRSQPSVSNADYQTNAFDDLVRFEEDEVNLLHFWGQELGKAQGSGKQWFGDYFLRTRSYTYSQPFSFPGRIADEPVHLKVSMALRAEQVSRFQVNVNEEANLTSQSARAIPVLSGDRDTERSYAERASLEDVAQVTGDNLSITVSYPYPLGQGDGSQGWLDYIQVRARRTLQITNEPIVFRDLNSLDATNTEYQIQAGGGDYQIWDITNPLQPRQQEFNASGNQLSFRQPSGQLKTYIAFRPNAASTEVEAIGQVGNQNLHGLNRADMVILYPEEFAGDAQRLADHRNSYSGLEVALVPIQQVYNEFSSGKLDPTAIRDFCHMLYQRDPQFRYLLLFGDGSFDARDIYGLGSNIIPTYQRDSFNPLFSFPADDYFGLLEDPNEQDPLVGRLNLAIGRLPVQTIDQARAAVDKIIHYDNSQQVLADWRNRVTFLADDEDSMLHTRDANAIADNLSSNNANINLEKIYLDAYPQVSTPGGNRIPEVTRAINQAIFKGTLILTYLGHGGSQGLAQERVLSISDIVNWTNYDNLTLLMTATCSFTGYDDPAFTTAGEEAFLNQRGGAIALMTTVRAVFASQNAALTRGAMSSLYNPVNGQLPTLGEAIMIAKNNYSGSNITINSRKFTLIGDPAQRLAIPSLNYQVVTSKIDTNRITANRTDTLRALQRVQISGEVRLSDGTLADNYNGIVYPTILDKEIQTTTLGQDPSSYPFDYDVQKNVIFRGRAQVTQGQFSFEFVVPKDINYNFGRGKISYYLAPDQGQTDGSGSYEDIIIGGNIEGTISDEEGPEIDVFMNTEDFVFGGITDPDPTLLVVLEDDFGINVVGNSIGHDLEAILDEDTQNSILLNDFFETDLGDFTKGRVRFPLEDLEEGRHTLRIKAWDVANNSAEGYTEFVVSESSELALRHVLNYPNPFTDRTCFQFDHNYANQELRVLVQIFTVSGRLVKTIEQQMFSDGAIRQDDCIEWDGLDDFGNQLARGVYLYKVRVQALVPGSEIIQGESDFEKMVLLK